MSPEEIRACMQKDGWPVEVLSASTMRSRFRGRERLFPLVVHLDPVFVTFAVLPFAKLPAGRSEGDVLMRRLLRLNREMNLAKFSVDEDGDVVLSVEYPLADLDPSEIRDAVDVLSSYANQFHREIEALAGGLAQDQRP